MEKTAKAPAKKTGNKTTELIVGAAAQKLTGVLKGINEAISEVNKLDERAAECSLKVVDLEDKIGGLDQELVNKAAQNKIELKNQFETDKRSFVDQWLTENSMISISEDELDGWKTRATNAETKMEETVKKEVAIATNSLKSHFEAEKKVLDLEYKTKEANNIAEMNQLKAQNKFLEEQINHWKTALDEERKAGVERAKASSIGTLNVGANGGR